MCWGDNIEGQLGVGTGGNKDIPTLVTGITTATKIALGSDHSCVVLEDSKIKCWGSNGHGQLGNDGNTGSYNTPVQVLGITTATNVVLGGDHSCALLMDATVTCWGRNQWGQLGDGTTDQRNSPATMVNGITTATDIALSHDHGCAVLVGGTVQC